MFQQFTFQKYHAYKYNRETATGTIYIASVMFVTLVHRGLLQANTLLGTSDSALHSSQLQLPAIEK